MEHFASAVMSVSREARNPSRSKTVRAAATRAARVRTPRAVVGGSFMPEVSASAGTSSRRSVADLSVMVLF